MLFWDDGWHTRLLFWSFVNTQLFSIEWIHGNNFLLLDHLIFWFSIHFILSFFATCQTDVCTLNTCTNTRSRLVRTVLQRLNNKWSAFGRYEAKTMYNPLLDVRATKSRGRLNRRETAALYSAGRLSAGTRRMLRDREFENLTEKEEDSVPAGCVSVATCFSPVVSLGFSLCSAKRCRWFYDCSLMYTSRYT